MSATSLKSPHVPKLGFLGGGNMAEAIINGVLKNGILPPENLFVTDAYPARREYLSERFPITVLDDNLSLIRNVDVLLFAVKPQNMNTVMEEIRPAARPDQVFLSICAGTKTSTIEDGLANDSAPNPRVIRIMPNTPAMIGLGMAGISGGSHATEADLDLPRRIFEAVGRAVIVDESMMDAVTAVSGSGPAYVFFLIEAMIDGAKAVGFSEADARTAVLQTVLGAATLAASSEKSPEELRKAVTSPGGTTAAGILMLETLGMREAVNECIDAARRRGEELSKS